MSAAIVRATLAYAAFAMLGGAFLLVVFFGIDASVRDVVMVLIGAIISNAKEAFSYFLGSSQSSHEKTQALAALAGDEGVGA